jgi:predicted nucleic acid-binding Zn ribbon protein
MAKDTYKDSGYYRNRAPGARNNSYRKSNEITLGAALSQVLTHLKLDSGIYESKIQGKWAEVMGPMISKHTKTIYLKDGKLYITVDSAPLKNELFYSRDKIIEVFNKELGGQIIKEVSIY